MLSVPQTMFLYLDHVAPPLQHQFSRRRRIAAKFPGSCPRTLILCPNRRGRRHRAVIYFTLLILEHTTYHKVRLCLLHFYGELTSVEERVPPSDRIPVVWIAITVSRHHAYAELADFLAPSCGAIFTSAFLPVLSSLQHLVHFETAVEVPSKM